MRIRVRGAFGSNSLDGQCVKQLVFPSVADLSAQLLQKDRFVNQTDNLTNFLFFQVQSGRVRIRGIKREVERRIAAQTKQDLPLEMAVIAVAHKNPNPEVCNGRQDADLAELGFIQHIVNILDGVAAVYPPGGRMTILTEGGLYKKGQIFDVTQSEIDRYEQQVRYMANAIGGGRINLTPLAEIIDHHPRFMDAYAQQLDKVSHADYGKYLAIMDRSMTHNQRMEGLTPLSMARRYSALHKAKHLCREDGGSAVYQHLQDTLGHNYLYCSVTVLDRPEVLVIDPSRVYREPFLLPQHGIGVLRSGGSDITVQPYQDFEKHAQSFRVGSIVCQDMGDQSFGYIDYGAKKK